MKSYIKTIIGALIIFLIVVGLNTNFKTFNAFYFLNASFVTGMILFLWGGLVWVSNEGVFKPFTYMGKRIKYRFTREELESYQEHSKNSSSDKKLLPLIIVGVFFIVLSFIIKFVTGL